MNTEATTSVDLESVMRRVRKLLAIAQDPRANPAEAAAAAGQAERIMTKFQLDHAQVLGAQMKSAGATFATVEVSANMKRNDPSRPALKKNPPWAGWLGVRCAKLNDCEVRFAHRQSPKGWEAVVQFCGIESDAQVAGWMFEYLVNELIKGMHAYQRGGVTRTKLESESYRRGFVMALCDQLRKAEGDKARDFAASSSGTALMVVKNQLVTEHFGEFKYGTAKAVEIKAGHAYRAGQAAGQKVDALRRAVGGAAGSSTLRLG